MLGRLYEFQIATWGARYKTYAAIFLITVSYGVLNSEVLGRSEQRVSYECLALTLLLMISLPILGPSIAKLKEGILSREDRDRSTD